MELDYRQLALCYGIGILASLIFTWPIGLLIVFFFAHINGDFRSDGTA